MAQHETPNNVYALFPGIDTRPFGKAIEPGTDHPDLADTAWSAEIPERTLADADDGLPFEGADRGECLQDPSRPRRRLCVRTLGVYWIGVAMLAGGALAIGRAALTAPSGHPSRAVASTGHPQPRLVLRHASTSVRAPRSVSRARHRPAVQARSTKRMAHPLRRGHSNGMAAPVAVVKSAPTSQPAPAPSTPQGSTSTPSQAIQPTTAADTTNSEPVASAGAASQPPGPTGLGQQVGGNCDPQCK
jgi:hypothetical protein